jgi:D-xylose transport system substrate-binding protein
LQRIVAGTQAMTVYKPVAKLAEKAARLAVDLARGKPIHASDALDNGRMKVPSIFADVAVVDSTNIVETVVADGFHSYDDIYRAIPEDKRPPRPSE